MRRAESIAEQLRRTSAEEPIGPSAPVAVDGKTPDPGSHAPGRTRLRTRAVAVAGAVVTEIASLSWPVMHGHLSSGEAESGEGLPLFLCQQDSPVRWLDVVLPEPIVVFWKSGGTLVEVNKSMASRWRFHSRADSFDLYPSGHYDRIHLECTAKPVVVLSVPKRWVASAELAPVLEVPHFQFYDHVLKRLVRALVAHVANGQPLGGLYTRSVSMAIVERLLTKDAKPDEPGSASGFAPSVLLCIRELLENQMADPPDIAAMAQLSSMGVAHFLREFKAAFGATPHQYVLQRRIERAKRLLLSEDESLSTVGLSLGFASHSHFTTAFRARTGTTPSNFRLRRGD